MKKYRIKINSQALYNIRDIAVWYDTQQTGLGMRFINVVIKQIEDLTENPQAFVIRYKDIRCLVVKKFPYMVHFYVNTQTSTIIVLAIISTSRNPKIWEEKTGEI